MKNRRKRCRGVKNVAEREKKTKNSKNFKAATTTTSLPSSSSKAGFSALCLCRLKQRNDRSVQSLYIYIYKRAMSSKLYSDDDEEEEEENDDSYPKDLYATLGLRKEDSPTSVEIKKAYHRFALKLHPDKNPSKDASKQFQTLQKVYAVLSDEKKRKAYDETGRVDEMDSEEFNDLYEYYRTMYKKVTEEDILQVTKEYLGSEEEARDLKACYVKFEGDMTKVFEWQMCSDIEFDSHRFAELIDGYIFSENLERYPKYEEYLKKHVRGKKAPVDPLTNRVSKKKLKSSGNGKENGEIGGGMGDLQALILAKNKSRAGAADDLFARLEEKYGGGGKKKEKSTPTKVKSGKVSKKK